MTKDYLPCHLRCISLKNLTTHADGIDCRTVRPSAAARNGRHARIALVAPLLDAEFRAGSARYCWPIDHVTSLRGSFPCSALRPAEHICMAQISFDGQFGNSRLLDHVERGAAGVDFVEVRVSWAA